MLSDIILFLEFEGAACSLVYPSDVKSYKSTIEVINTLNIVLLSVADWRTMCLLLSTPGHSVI